MTDQEKNKLVSTLSNATLIAGGTLAIPAISRSASELAINPDKITVQGGSSNRLSKNPKFKTVFDTQREAWVKNFNPYKKVEEKSSFTTHKKYPNASGIPTTLSKKIDGVSSAHVDVGSGPFSEVKALLRKTFLGIPSYRITTDFGPGNFNQPARDGSKNMMFASKSENYTRNIIPGGEFFDNTPNAEKPNININSIPTKYSDLEVAPKRGNVKNIVIANGSGYGWQDSKFPHGRENLNTIFDAINEHYKDTPHKIVVLGGPNVSKEYDTFFQEHAKNKNILYGKGTTEKGVINLLGKSDINFIAPGSVLAEMASAKKLNGKSILFNIDAGKSSGHYKHNIKWYTEASAPNTQSLDIMSKTPISKDSVLKVLRESAKSNAERKQVKLNGTDMSKIVNTMKEDLAQSGRFTKKLTLLSTGLLAGGAAMQKLNNQ